MGEKEDLEYEQEDIGVGKGLEGRGRLPPSRGILIGLLLILVLIFAFWFGFNLPRLFSQLKEGLTAARKPAPSIEAPATEEAVTLPLEAAGPPKRIKPQPRLKPRAIQAPKVVKLYKVQAGIFEVKENAVKLCGALGEKGFPSFIKETEEGAWRVQAGAFKTKEQAQPLVGRLNSLGFEAVVILE